MCSYIQGVSSSTKGSIHGFSPSFHRCLTCGNYVYKGRKFNSRKEDAQGEKYLGIQIYRFYIRCPECLSEITFKVCTNTRNLAIPPSIDRILLFKQSIELTKILSHFIYRQILRMQTMYQSTGQLGHSRWAWLINNS